MITKDLRVEQIDSETGSYARMPFDLTHNAFLCKMMSRMTECSDLLLILHAKLNSRMVQVFGCFISDTAFAILVGFVLTIWG